MKPTDKPYMATNVSMDRLKEALFSGIFKKGGDVEMFINKIRKYFEFSGIMTSCRNLLVVGFLDKELQEIYENEDEALGFEERLRKFFLKPSSMIKDIEEALSYRRNGEHVSIYKKRIEEMVDKIMSFKWNKDVLMKELVMNSCDDNRMKLKIKSGKKDKVEEIFQTIKECDNLKEEIKMDNVNVVQIDKDAAKRIPEQLEIDIEHKERTDLSPEYSTNNPFSSILNISSGLYLSISIFTRFTHSFSAKISVDADSPSRTKLLILFRFLK